MFGDCECGCGEPTLIATHNDRSMAEYAAEKRSAAR